MLMRRALAGQLSNGVVRQCVCRTMCLCEANRFPYPLSTGAGARQAGLTLFLGQAGVTTPACCPLNIFSTISISKNRAATTLAGFPR